MDNAAKNKAEEAGEERALIDVFYKDTYRLDSLISQINNGALQTIITTMDNSQGSISSTKGTIGVQGLISIGADDNTSKSTKSSIQETKTPFDDSIIQILGQLGLSPQLSLPQRIFSSLQIVQGAVSLKNYKMFSEIIPVISSLAPFFDEKMKKRHQLEQYISMLKNKSSKSSEEKKQLKQWEEELFKQKVLTASEDEIFKNLHMVLPFFPKGIGFEVRLDDDSVLTGNLKSEYLIDTEESIFLNFGEALPDRWNVLGIVDYKSDNLANENSTPLAALSTIMKGISSMFFQSESKATVIPLLIYRELSIE